VPHVYGKTRADVEFGAGYVVAEDRLFFMDVLRHLGRAQLSEFAGGSNRGLDAEQWQVAPYTERDLQDQIDRAASFGAEGLQLKADLENYVAGINAYIAEAKAFPATKMPAEYAGIGKPEGPDIWKTTDVVATASLIGAIFGKGGGGEVNSAQVLAAAKKRFGSTAGTAVWNDFRRAEDPEAPTTVRGTSFPYQAPATVNPQAVALPDDGSLVGPQGTGSSSSGASSASSSSEGLSSLLRFPTSNSNALLISGANSESGRPLAVMGPQTGYFMPEILNEQDLHCIGDCQGQPDIDATGAAFPGISLYVLLGRGPDFAWSATSAGQDITDTFADELCEPDGSAPTRDSMHYRYKGQCRPIEVLERTNVVKPNAADQCGSAENPCGPFTLKAQRTVHGIVYKRGTVGGKPVAFTRLRSTYFHETDSALAFKRLNNPKELRNAQDFQQAMSNVGFTFNWFYADDRDIAYFNSGNNPVRASGVDHNFPTWGTGAYDWQNFDPLERDASGNLLGENTADYTPFAEHPQVVNQSWITSWNNKQAPGYRAADDQYAFGPVYRSQSLDRRITQRLSSGDKFSLPELIDAMEDAGTVDLRGAEVLPWMLQAVGNPDPTKDPDLASAVSKLRAWLNAGAHRRDCTPVAGGCAPDGRYEHEDAVRIMDAWWPKAVAAQFQPTLANELYNSVLAVMGLDNSPHTGGDHVGSAYQSGWYGYVQKDLRKLLHRSVQGGFSRVYCGGGKLNQCRTDLRNALRAALAVPASELYDEKPGAGNPGTQRVDGCPSTSSDQWCYDSVRFRPIGALNVETIHWINRPTFQQAVEVQGHRPR
jgi:acyl-homoserine lactone acylase PvdQ